MDYMERALIRTALVACTASAAFVIGLKLVRHFAGA